MDSGHQKWDWFKNVEESLVIKIIKYLLTMLVMVMVMYFKWILSNHA